MRLNLDLSFPSFGELTLPESYYRNWKATVNIKIKIESG